MRAKPKYLDQYVNYGGEWRSVGSLYVELGVNAGMWLAGYRARGGEYVDEIQPDYMPDDEL